MFTLGNIISFGLGIVVTYETMRHKLKKAELAANKALELTKKTDGLMSTLNKDIDMIISAMQAIK